MINLRARVDVTFVSDRLTASVTADGQQQLELAPGIASPSAGVNGPCGWCASRF